MLLLSEYESKVILVRIIGVKMKIISLKNLIDKFNFIVLIIKNEKTRKIIR